MKKTLVLIAVAVPTGIAVGAVDAVFGRVLLYLGAVRDAHTAWFLPFLGLIGALMAWAYKRYGAGCENGMGMVFEAGHAEREAIPLRLVPFVICATWLTHLFGGSAGREGVAVQLAAAPEWSAELALELTALGIVFGLTGAAFAFCLKRAKKLAQNRLKNPVLRALVMGVALSAVLYLLYRGRYCGLGTNLINASLAGEPIYAWDWALKLALTVLTLSAGFQGGEVTPLFSIGGKPGRGPGGPPGPAGGLLRGAGLRRSVRLRNEHPARPGPHRGRGLRLGSGAALFRRMRPVLCRERRPVHLFGTEMNTAAVFAALHSKARRNGRYFVLQSLLYA